MNLKTYNKIFIFLLTITLFTSKTNCQLDGVLPLRERCARYGFGYEEYEVTTQDGYILRLMRIPSAPNNQDRVGQKPPVYMIHPFGMDSEVFFIDGPDRSPGFSLANRGYDVWLSNARYTQYSRRHITLDPERDPEFYNFDLVTLRFDIMADIEFILQTVNYDTVTAYGYAFGGTVLSFAMAIEPQFFRRNVNLAALIAAPVSLANTGSMVFVTLARMNTAINNFRNAGIQILGVGSNFGQIYLESVWIPVPILWLSASQLLLGENDPRTDDPRGIQNLVLQDNPLPIQVMQHALQSARTGRVSYLDYGPEVNMQIYGTEEAPLIPLQNTNIPIALFGSTNDLSTDTVDLEWYADIIQDNLVFFQYYPISHSGFISSDTDEYITDLTNLIDTFQEPSVR